MQIYAVSFIPLLGSLYLFRTFYVYGSVHHNIFYEITNRCSYMQSVLFHCYVHSTCFGHFMFMIPCIIIQVYSMK